MIKQTNKLSNREDDARIAKSNMDKQAERMQKSFNVKRNPAKSYSVGDLVLWCGSNVSKQRSAEKQALNLEDLIKSVKLKEMIGMRFLL